MCPPHNATLKNDFISAIANQTKDSDGFAKYLFSALVKTYVWAIGEVGMEDLNSKKDQIYDVIAKFIFLSFLLSVLDLSIDCERLSFILVQSYSQS